MKLPVIYSKDLIKVAQKFGFKEIRQKGSHKTFSNSENKIFTIPYHTNKPVPIGLLHKIIREDLGISIEEFIDNL